MEQGKRDVQDREWLAYIFARLVWISEERRVSQVVTEEGGIRSVAHKPEVWGRGGGGLGRKVCCPDTLPEEAC